MRIQHSIQGALLLSATLGLVLVTACDPPAPPTRDQAIETIKQALCVHGEASCSEGNRYICSNGQLFQQNCPFGTVCTGAGQCEVDTSVCQPGQAICTEEGHRLACIGGIFKTQNCAFGSFCVGDGQCTGGPGCENQLARCTASGAREVCANGGFYASPCPTGLVCSGAGECTGPDNCVNGAARCTANGGREVCSNGTWMSMSCPAGTTCTGAGDCTAPPPPPPPVISDLVVNDTANAGDWSIQSSFSGGNGELAFGDRQFTIATIPAAAKHLVGRAWIRTAADSKTYNGNPTLASATLNGNSLFLALDARYINPTFLTGIGFTKEAYTITINEGTQPRTYNVWFKAITPGTRFDFPRINATTAPTYIIIVQ